MTLRDQSDLFMPRELYLHLRDLCMGGSSDAVAVHPNTCGDCAAIVAWARGEPDPRDRSIAAAERALGRAVS
jgi:hypothetical protein